MFCGACWDLVRFSHTCLKGSGSAQQLPSFQGAGTGLAAGLAAALWVGIGSIVTRSGAGRTLPVNCSAVTPSHNSSAVGGAVLRWVWSVWFWSQRFWLTVCVSREPSALQRFYSLSYMWYSGFSCVSVVLVGLAVSFLTGTVRSQSCLARGSVRFKLYGSVSRSDEGGGPDSRNRLPSVRVRSPFPA